MRRTNLKRWLIICLLPTLLLLEGCLYDSYPASSYYLAIVRDPEWKWDSSQGNNWPIVFLSVRGVECTSNEYPLLSMMPTLFSVSICDAPGDRNKPTLKISNNFPDAPDAPIRYLIVSEEHPSTLGSAEEVRKVESELGRAYFANQMEDMSKIIDRLKAEGYPYAGKVQPGEYVEVPNLFTW